MSPQATKESLTTSRGLNNRDGRASKTIVPLFVLAVVVLSQAQGVVPTFPQTVLNGFAVWDSDRDGQLTASEIDKAALDPKFHGPEAAALAALHGWLVSAKEPIPALTRQWFQDYKPVRFQAQKGAPASEVKEERKAYTASPGSLQSVYTASLRRLSRMNRTELYDADGPSLADIRQGALGDCYMLAPLGAFVHRQSTAVRDMIRPEGDGYQVRFGDGQEVHVGQLTDTELAMGGSSTKSGLWIRVIEKAYGSRKIQEGEEKIATDSMHGGNSGVAGKAFTGHKFSSIALIGDFQKEVAAEKLNAKLEQLRASIPKAVSEGRLVVAGTAKRDMPKSISPNHAYAIFGYDPKTDRITIWNPHGNDFAPKGEEGPVNGYKIDDGVFSMPLDMFVRTFSRILFEERPS